MIGMPFTVARMRTAMAPEFDDAATTSGAWLRVVVVDCTSTGGNKLGASARTAFACGLAAYRTAIFSELMQPALPNDNAPPNTANAESARIRMADSLSATGARVPPRIYRPA